MSRHELYIEMLSNMIISLASFIRNVYSIIITQKLSRMRIGGSLFYAKSKNIIIEKKLKIKQI